MDEFDFEIKDFGLISDTKINLGKINIVGGLNSTGKSTASKLLYIILRSNSKTRRNLALKTIVTDVVEVGFELLNFSRFNLDDDSNEGIQDEIRDILNEITKKMRDHVHPQDFKILDDFEKLKQIYEKSNLKKKYRKIIDISFEDIQKLVDILEENGDELFKTIFNQLIKQEFGKDKTGLNNITFYGNFNNEPFKYNINVLCSEFNIEGWFIMEDVFYLDSFSAFDLMSAGGLQNTEHINHIFQSLDDDESADWGDEILNDNIIEIENKIMEITGGRFEKVDKNILFKYSDKEFLMKNTSSGIKQLGIIQMLLNTRKLTKNSFLIMDEPEVNLHPEWQVKFAEVIILLAKELDIKIYINSHSPLFIEAIKTYSDKYKLLDETNFYLSNESETVEGTFNIEQIPSTDLNIIFNTLGKPYELLSKISIETEFGL